MFASLRERLTAETRDTARNVRWSCKRLEYHTNVLIQALLVISYGLLGIIFLDGQFANRLAKANERALRQGAAQSHWKSARPFGKSSNKDDTGECLITIVPCLRCSFLLKFGGIFFGDSLLLQKSVKFGACFFIACRNSVFIGASSELYYTFQCFL